MITTYKVNTDRYPREWYIERYKFQYTTVTYICLGYRMIRIERQCCPGYCEIDKEYRR